MADVMAENQTEAVLAQLDRGDADPKLQTTVLAAVLRAVTKAVEQLEDVKKSLWSARELEDLVDERHRKLCLDCPLRSAPPKEPADKPHWLLSLLTNPSFQMYAIMAILVFALVYKSAGPDALEAVKGALPAVGIPN